MEHIKPLWVITFDPKTSEKPFQERTVFSSFPKHPLISSESSQLALDFLNNLNTSLKNITEAYLSLAENNEDMKPKADEIKERLDVLNHWLEWIRTWLQSPPEKEDID